MTVPLLAGVLDPAGATREDEVAARRALEAGGLERAEGAHRSGPLALAWSSAAVVRRPDSGLLVVAGRLHRDGPPQGDPYDDLARDLAIRGLPALAEARGEFGAAWWNPASGNGLIARDQMGVGGMAFAVRGRRLVFATEPSLVLRLLPTRPGPDRESVARWIAVGVPGAGRTFWDGVRRLGPGEAMALGSGEPPRRYWMPVYVRPEPMERPEAVHRVRGALDRAVARRAGERSGLLASGGIDSTAVAGIAARTGRPLPLYTATFPSHPSIDELHLVELTAGMTGGPLTAAAVKAPGPIAGAIPYVRRWQQPPSSPNLGFWGALLDRAAADGSETVLDGEGGDELFTVAAYLLADRIRSGRLASAVRLAGRLPGPEGARRLRRTRGLLRNYGVRGALPPFAHRLKRRLRAAASYGPSYLLPEAAAHLASEDRGWSWKELDGPRWWAAHVGRTVMGAGPMLAYDHVRMRSAMSGVLPSHPLTDADLVETVLRIPPEVSYEPSTGRPLLREAVRGLVPEEVRTRVEKSGFDEPFHDALAGPDLPLVREVLLNPDAQIRSWCSTDELGKTLLAGEPPAAPARVDWALRVWRLMTAELWLLGEAGQGSRLDQIGAQASAPVVEVRRVVGPD